MLTVRKDLFQAKQQNISKAFTSILLFIIQYKSSLFLVQCFRSFSSKKTFEYSSIFSIKILQTLTVTFKLSRKMETPFNDFSVKGSH